MHIIDTYFLHVTLLEMKFVGLKKIKLVKIFPCGLAFCK